MVTQAITELEQAENQTIEAKQEPRSIREIVKDLSKPLAQKHLRKRRQGGKEILYLAWHDAVIAFARRSGRLVMCVGAAGRWPMKGRGAPGRALVRGGAGVWRARRPNGHGRGADHGLISRGDGAGRVGSGLAHGRVLWHGQRELPAHRRTIGGR